MIHSILRSARVRVSLLVIVAFAGSAVLVAAPPAKVPQGTPLLVWFGSAVGDGLRSDGRTITVNGTTADYANSVAENSLATVGYNFRFDLQGDKTKPPVRCLTVDFGTQLQGVAGPVPQSFACVNVEEPMHAYASSDVELEKMALNQQTDRLTRFCWNYAGYRWRIGYGTDMDQNGVLDSPPVSVTCTVAERRGCNRWLMTPKASGAGATGTAALFRFALLPGGAEGPAEFVAMASMPFSMTFVRQ